MTQHQALVPAPASIFTPARRALFCEQLSGHGNVRHACKAAGVSAQTAYRARRACGDFAACWDAALVLAREHVEQVLADRALNGVEEEVWYHGEVVATRRRYDSRLLLAHLARLDAKAVEVEQVLPLSSFDAGLCALEAGEPVVRAPAAAGEGLPGLTRPYRQEEAEEEALPPVEAALRWLEAQEQGRGLDAPDLSPDFSPELPPDQGEGDFSL